VRANVKSPQVAACGLILLAEQTQPGSRQQPGPQGPCDGGGQLDVTGNDAPFADGRAGALSSFSIDWLPQVGHVGLSLLRTSSSNAVRQGGQWNSKRGMIGF